MSKEIEKIIKKVQSEADKKNQANLQKLKNEIKKEFGNQTGVLIEEFQHRVSAIGEQYPDIKKTLESHSNQIANLLMDSTEIKSDVRDIKLRIRLGLEDKVDRKHFVDLEGRVRILERV